ncbi:leucine Rich Repeat [Seminavis robusta]|uniref:Leucine Rich Repeat n=1 Tax=Seminavis robusta TaxID=568900 RepID=A0A9N8EW80_9STRA|nr:leucine Rich Repeat [Seminavis robusta]|eukprot:Sro1788_g297610.1 leucine Rich Repeat (569) ;mRNA; r:9621-11935
MRKLYKSPSILASLLVLEPTHVTATLQIADLPTISLGTLLNIPVTVPDFFGWCFDRSLASFCIFPADRDQQASPREGDATTAEGQDNLIDDYSVAGTIDLARFWVEDMCSSVVNEPAKRELLALAKFFYQLDGGPNVVSSSPGSGWLVGCDPCSWGGVLCNSERRVVELLLASSGLSGQVSPSLGSLEQLVVLDLRYNEGLVGTIPEELGLLSDAESIRLSGTSLSGPMPESICDLLLPDLEADCGGSNPMVSCDCCAYCSTTTTVDVLVESVADVPPSFAPVQATPLPTIASKTEDPTMKPSQQPTPSPQATETQFPTQLTTSYSLSEEPTFVMATITENVAHTESPTEHPSETPSDSPTGSPTMAPTTVSPTGAPTQSPTTRSREMTSSPVSPIPAPTYDGNPAEEWLSESGCRNSVPILRRLNLVSLASLYFSTKNTRTEGPLYDLGWLGSCDPCTWGQISCDELGNIVGLDLSSLELRGRIHPYTGLLTDLISLNLQDNQLTGEIPFGLQYLSNAESILLHDNLLWGDMPPEICSLRSQQLNELSSDCSTEETTISCDCCSLCA